MHPLELPPMPRRFPLPLPVRPALLARLEALHLAGARRDALQAELEREPVLARGVTRLQALDPLGSGSDCTTSELRGLVLAAALLAELESSGQGTPFSERRDANLALACARLCARIARRLPRPLGLAGVEFFCLPLVRAVARARVDPSLATPGAMAREAARLGAAWGLSGVAIEALGAWGPASRTDLTNPAVTALELARGLTESAGGNGRRGDLEGAGAREAARLLGLRSAELAELAEFAVSVLAVQAA